jgi:hypothetical protein
MPCLGSGMRPGWTAAKKWFPFFLQRVYQKEVDEKNKIGSNFRFQFDGFDGVQLPFIKHMCPNGFPQKAILCHAFLLPFLSLSVCRTGLPDAIFSIWVNFGGSCNRRYWYILWPFGLFYGHLVYAVDIWSMLWPYNIYYGFLVYFSHFGML